jgi:hypothetical protein
MCLLGVGHYYSYVRERGAESDAWCATQPLGPYMLYMMLSDLRLNVLVRNYGATVCRYEANDRKVTDFPISQLGEVRSPCRVVPDATEKSPLQTLTGLLWRYHTAA